MRNLLVRSNIGLMAGLLTVLALSPAAIGQTAMPQKATAPGTKDSLYKGNKLKPNPESGGPAPVHDVSGSWAGNLAPERLEIPPLTPLGQKLFSLNKPETEVGTGHSNDPLNTCDPVGHSTKPGFRNQRALPLQPWGPTKLLVLASVSEDLALRLDGRQARTAQEYRYQGWSARRAGTDTPSAIGMAITPW